MKNLYFILPLLCMACAPARAQQVTIDQYCYYYGSKEKASVAGIAAFDSRNNWHTELRYNYDELHTVSVYAGKSFVHTGELSYRFTPMAGMVTGKLKAAAAALNHEMEWKFFSFSTQMQYAFTMQPGCRNYFYSWSELDYQPAHWIYSGFALQQTLTNTSKQAQPGIVAGLVFGNTSFPVYVFGLKGRTNVILECNFAIACNKKSKPLLQ